MRNFGVISAVAAAGLLSHGAFALPTPPRVVYPYPVYRSDEVASIATKMSHKSMSSSQARLEMLSAAFSKAIDVGFVTVILRPHEHLVSLLVYYNPRKRVALSHTISSGHIKRGLTQSIDPPIPGDELPSSLVRPREDSGDPGAFNSHDYRRSEDDMGGDKKSFPEHDYRRSTSENTDATLFSYHDYKRSAEVVRSSTHSTSREHLKAREDEDHPPRQPPVHNPE